MYSLSDAKPQYPEIYEEYYSQPHSRHILVWGETWHRSEIQEIVKSFL